MRQEVKSGVIEKALRNDQDVILNIHISYPILLPGMRNGAPQINRHYETHANYFLQYGKDTLFPYAHELHMFHPNLFRPHELTVQYKISYMGDHLLSIYTDVYQYAGGAHGSTHRYAHTWNMETGALVPLDAFFPPNDMYQEKLIRQVAETGRKKFNIQDEKFDTFLASVGKYFNKENYYLTKDGLAIFFQEYDIAPYAAGIPVFIIAHSETGPFFPDCISSKTEPAI